MYRSSLRFIASACLITMAALGITATEGTRLLNLRAPRARNSVNVDTNFDGRYDEQDFYDRGVLVRRELDRNHDSRVDLVEIIDRTTRQPVRVVVDNDFDGRADRLLLYSGGRAVYSEALSVSDSDIGRDTRRKLTPLFDPSGREAALATPQTASPLEDVVTLIESVATLDADVAVAACVAQTRASTPVTSRLDSLIVSPRSPRGPPVRLCAST